MPKPVIPYNPLDKRNLGRSIAQSMLIQPIESMPEFGKFIGAGVYAIYYRGSFPPYEKLALANATSFNVPIYVGKAVPGGARKGSGSLDSTSGSELYKRLSEHRSSIRETSNLQDSDFFIRYLVVDDIWIPLGESLLIEMFQPLWNVAIDGFGNHTPGKGRFEQQASPWDVLHPGRKWVASLQPGKPLDEVQKMVALHLAKVSTPK